MGKAIDPQKVAIYIRWSTDDQADGTTLDVQLEGCKAYVISQGWAVTDELIFIDDGYSGGNLDRPALTRLRQRIREGAVDCVVVLKLDRLSRSVPDMVRLVIDEWGDLCYLKSAREPIDTTSHAGRMFFYTLTSFAEWERATIRERTFSGKLKRAQAGQNPGMRAPYGYRNAGGQFAIVPEEAAVVQEIFARYRMGYGTAQIAHHLNREGIPHRDRRRWDKTDVHRILTRPLYCGDLAYGVRSRNPRYGKQPGQRFWLKNEQPLAVAAGAVPPIISRELYQQVQQLRESRPNPHRKQSGRALASGYLLSGLLRCARCGAAMYGRTQSPGGRRYYVCSGQHGGGPAVCGAGHLPMQQIDDLVVGLFKGRYGRSALRDAYVRECLSGLAAERESLCRRLAHLEARRQRLDEQEARLRRAFREEALTLAELRQNLGDLEAERRELAGARADLARTLAALDAALGPEGRAGRLLEQMDAWEVLPPADRKQVLRWFVAEVRAYRPARSGGITCEITWRVDEAEERAPGADPVPAPLPPVSAAARAPAETPRCACPPPPPPAR